MTCGSEYTTTCTGEPGRKSAARTDTGAPAAFWPTSNPKFTLTSGPADPPPKMPPSGTATGTTASEEADASAAASKALAAATGSAGGDNGFEPVAPGTGVAPRAPEGVDALLCGVALAPLVTLPVEPGVALALAPGVGPADAPADDFPVGPTAAFAAALAEAFTAAATDAFALAAGETGFFVAGLGDAFTIIGVGVGCKGATVGVTTPTERDGVGLATGSGSAARGGGGAVGITAFDEVDDAESPTTLIALTRNLYSVPLLNPVHVAAVRPTRHKAPEGMEVTV